MNIMVFFEVLLFLIFLNSFHNGVNCFHLNCSYPNQNPECKLIENSCSPNPCVTGKCVLVENGWKCICPHYTFGVRCEIGNGPCERGYCSINSDCSYVTDLNQYNCDCHPGYIGSRCEFNICELHKCSNDGYCNKRFNGISWEPFCECPYGFSGTYCENNDLCNQNNCFIGKCMINISSAMFTCECFHGYTGPKCSIPPNKCLESPCLNNQECIQIDNGFQCFCTPPFTGQYCEKTMNSCSGVGCAYGGYCSMVDYLPICKCINGWGGPDCSFPIDQCSAISNMKCLNNGHCIFDGEYFKCDCAEGYFGNQCQYEDSSCLFNHCQNNGSCITQEKYNRLSYKCKCAKEFTGELCQLDVDECTFYRDLCSNDTICYNYFGGFVCLNKDIEQQLLRKFSLVCSSGICKNGGTCISDSSGINCQCPIGFFGLYCQLTIDSCIYSLCLDEGTLFCRNIGTRSTCICKPGYFGKNCNVRKVCPCVNGGTCSLNGSCICSKLYYGVYCHLISDDRCLAHGCNMGYCIEDTENYGKVKCNCINSNYGNHCEYSSKIIGIDNLKSYVCPNNLCFELPICLKLDQKSQLINERIASNDCVCNSGELSSYCTYVLIPYKAPKLDHRDCANNVLICKNNEACINFNNQSRCLCQYGTEDRCLQTLSSSSVCPFDDCLNDRKYCKAHCKIPQCEYGGDNCTLGVLPWSSCPYELQCWASFKNNICDITCNNEECLFDGFDCVDRVCKDQEYCKYVYLDGECDFLCNNKECLWDGGDCDDNWQTDTYFIRIIFETDILSFKVNTDKVLYELGSLLSFPINIKLNPDGKLAIYEIISFNKDVLSLKFKRSISVFDEKVASKKLAVEFVTDIDKQLMDPEEAIRLISASAIRNKINLPFEINKIETGKLSNNKYSQRYLYIISLSFLILLTLFLIIASLSFRSNTIRKTIKARLINSNLPIVSYKNISTGDLVDDKDPCVSSRIPLMLYACSDDYQLLNSEILQMKNNGISLDVRIESSGLTALHMAIQQLNEKNAILLVKSGADPLVIDANRRNAIHKAVSLGFNVFLNYIFSRDQNLKIQQSINSCDINGYTPLIDSVRNHHIVTTNLLLFMKANINLHDHEGRNALHWAVLSDNHEALSILLSSKSLVDIQDSLGQTPLHLAVIKNSLKAVEILLAYDASFEIMDSNNQTVLDLIESSSLSSKDKSQFFITISNCILIKKLKTQSNRSTVNLFKSSDKVSKDQQNGVHISLNSPNLYTNSNVKTCKDQHMSCYNLNQCEDPLFEKLTYDNGHFEQVKIDDETAACLAAELLDDIETYSCKFTESSSLFSLNNSFNDHKTSEEVFLIKKRLE